MSDVVPHFQRKHGHTSPLVHELALLRIGEPARHDRGHFLLLCNVPSFDRFLNFSLKCGKNPRNMLKRAVIVEEFRVSSLMPAVEIKRALQTARKRVSA